MTANQVAYWQLQEAKRHNAAQENIAQQHATTEKWKTALDAINPLKTVAKGINEAIKLFK